MTKITPGATIGILGGGQLARMLALSCAQLGLKTHIFSPVADDPAFDVSAKKTQADFLDESALNDFARSVDIITYEFENVPARTAQVLESLRPVRPNPKVLALTQDRLIEKQFIRRLEAQTAEFSNITDIHSLKQALNLIGYPSILKTRRLGYDGKGQAKVTDQTDLEQVYASFNGADCILEGFVNFSKEISVVAARSLDGMFSAYDICENVHENHILSTTLVPAAIKESTAQAAIHIAQKIAEAADYVGIFAVEMFVVGAHESLIINEIAPRVHNSGHWTLGGAVTSQFEQHIRAIAGWPLGSTQRLGVKVSMQNLIGHDCEQWNKLLSSEGSLHLYGKKESRPGRKMGHFTKIHL